METEIMAAFVVKHKEEVKKLKLEIANLRAKKRFYKLQVNDRDEKIIILEVKLAEMEKEVTRLREENERLSSKALKGNLTPPLEIMEIVELYDEADFVPLADTTIEVTNIDDDCEFTSANVSSIDKQGRISKKSSSWAMIDRMIKQVHRLLGKNSWNSKPIDVNSAYKGVMGKLIFITCPECHNRIPTTPTFKNSSERRGNFSINHYKKHIKIKHC
jgi:hypothetical protein